MEAKMKIEEIAKRMNEIGGSDGTFADKEEQARLREEYFKLEQEMVRLNTALMITEEYQAEIERAERQWEADNEAANNEALKKLRRHMPVNIRHLSEAELTTTLSPNGKYLPISIAKKFKRTNILQCLRLNPNDLECMHSATLENMRVTGLTLTERRALFAHFKPIGPKWEKNKAEKMTERKWTWYQMMKNNFKEALAPYQRHIEQFGPPENHQCTLTGKQCPIKADKIIDYDGDYGWTTEAKYEVSKVRKADVEDSGAQAMAEARELAKEKKANGRTDQLKKHYKGKLLQVSKANGSCESMDEAMDHMEFNIMRWIEFIMEKGENESEADKKKEVANFTDALIEFKLKVLDFAQRSGMQMTGKKTDGGDKPDIRSSVEASLAEEVFECSIEFFGFITKRMREIGIKDTRVLKTIETLVGILDELHGRNQALFQSLGTKRSERSRKLKKSADLKKEVEEKLKCQKVPNPICKDYKPRTPATLNLTAPMDTPVNIEAPYSGDVAVINFKKPPTNGRLTIQPNNTVTYTPNPGFVGIDEFIVEFCYTDARCDTVNVVIDVKSGPNTSNVPADSSKGLYALRALVLIPLIFAAVFVGKRYMTRNRPRVSETIKPSSNTAPDLPLTSLPDIIETSPSPSALHSTTHGVIGPAITATAVSFDEIASRQSSNDGVRQPARKGQSPPGIESHMLSNKDQCRTHSEENREVAFAKFGSRGILKLLENLLLCFVFFACVLHSFTFYMTFMHLIFFIGILIFAL
jgi:hypothetical protein